MKKSHAIFRNSEHYIEWAMALKGTDGAERKTFFGFCKASDFGRNCGKITCINNIIASKVFKILYAFVMRARSENLDIYLEDIVPTQEIELFVETHLTRSGFDGALILDSRYPDGKTMLNDRNHKFDFFRNHKITITSK